jgi:hypothetical protein
MLIFGPAHVLFLLLLAGLFFLPTIIAARKEHPNRIGIFVLNLLMGWTGLEWIVALIWALFAPPLSSPQKSESN